MARVTVTVEDDHNGDIKVSISSSSPELPLRSDIKSADNDLTPAQAAVFEMLELYMVANEIDDGDGSEQSSERPCGNKQKKKCCGGGKCKKPPSPPEQASEA